jgi:hypothetical protein
MENKQESIHLFQTSHQSLYLQDPIIQQILSTRKIDSDEPESDEDRTRLVMMVKQSKKYRKLSIKAANQRWTEAYNSDGSEFFSTPSQSSQSDSDTSRRVKFATHKATIDLPQKRSILQKIVDHFRKNI